MEKNWSYTITEKGHPHEGETLWSGRYCAIAAFIYCKINGHWYILANKRGKGTPDFQGYWNCPCGFLEANESAEEGCSREVEEETGLYVNPKLFKFAGVQTDPRTSNKGHVTLRYYAVINEEDLDPICDVSELKGGEKDEVEEVEWVAISDIFEKDTYQNWAFGHKNRIKSIFNIYILYNL